MLNKAGDTLFIRKSQYVILCYTIPAIEIGENDVPLIPLTTLKVSTTIVEFDLILDRMLVFTRDGKIKLFFGDLSKDGVEESVLIGYARSEKARTIDLGISTRETVTAGCVSYDGKYIAVATQRAESVISFNNRIRMYEVMSMRKIKYLCMFEEKSYESKFEKNSSEILTPSFQILTVFWIFLQNLKNLVFFVIFM